MTAAARFAPFPSADSRAVNWSQSAYRRTLQVDWGGHRRDLVAFWVGVLLEAPDRDPERVTEAHRWLHEAAPFDAELFERWLAIFESVLDAGWSGPVAERARRRAHGYAWAMAKRLAGVDIGAARLVGR